MLFYYILCILYAEMSTFYLKIVGLHFAYKKLKWYVFAKNDFLKDYSKESTFW